MRKATAESALKLQERIGDGFEVVEFEQPTRTSEEAAVAIGCEMAEIAKSLIFKLADGTALLVIASGTNRVDEKKLKRLMGQKVSRASPELVREATGFAIGGVAPVTLGEQPATLLDADLQKFSRIWAAGGTPNAVFALTPDELAEMTGASFEDVVKR